MTSQTDLCNLALAALGMDLLVNLNSDTTISAQKCNLFFNYLARETISRGSWTSCIYRAELARILTTPVFDYAFAYQLPVDPSCLRVLNVNDSENLTEYKIENGLLLTDAESVKIRYIAYITDTDKWDIMLERAFIARMTAALAYGATGNMDIVKTSMQVYESLVREGITLDNQQGSKEAIIVDDFTKIRLGY